MHFLDATPQEETAVPLRMHVMYAFPGGKPVLHSLRMAGVGTSGMTQVKALMKVRCIFISMAVHAAYTRSIARRKICPTYVVWTGGEAERRGDPAGDKGTRKVPWQTTVTSIELIISLPCAHSGWLQCE